MLRAGTVMDSLAQTPSGWAEARATPAGQKNIANTKEEIYTHMIVQSKIN